ncbi:hypothetical protein HDIA_0071 [Hartmannibacter diazotrophicus]|uniref:Lipoprotein n=1 Tax=Hartmannibacter diazotrophicus TaxID=1482074 RepID=A0A2C9CZU8_9HYPH|nr:hypothetical protein [Hartmannibacter diazotrophicus]SON53612.1 hypothetical protein HDIA_0071 [Hartmannibacter diazotrophicus]
MRLLPFILAMLLSACSAGVGVGTATIRQTPDGTITATGNSYSCGVAVPAGQTPPAGCGTSGGTVTARPY